MHFSRCIYTTVESTHRDSVVRVETNCVLKGGIRVVGGAHKVGTEAGEGEGGRIR